MSKVAAIQLSGAGTPEANLARAAELLAEAAAQGAKLAVLPENFVYYNSSDITAAAEIETRGGPDSARHLCRQLARQHGLWLVAGTLPILDRTPDSADPRPFACSILIAPDGREAARYNKIHLFDVQVGSKGKSYCESDTYRHGSTPVCAPGGVGSLGLSVCYDLRFPELYRELAASGAEILAAPSAFTATTGAAHWRLLLQARAVENICYMIGANLGHRDHPKKPTWGGSAIIDPWGEVLAELGDGEGLLVAELDLARVRELRRRMPVLEHRRL